jgi:uncharacterized protein DUF4112
MSVSVDPEVIPPDAPWPPAAAEEGNLLSDENLEYLVALLDDIFRIPLTGIRFGLDPVIGLIPGAGDWITGAVSFLVLVAGWQRGLPRVALTRMVVNIGIDSLAGTVPLLGDVFDVGWKSNRKNFALLQAYREPQRRSQTWRDWAFLLALVGTVGLLLALPLVALLLMVHWLRG